MNKNYGHNNTPIITALLKARARYIGLCGEEASKVVKGHLGFTLALRREIMPLLQQPDGALMQSQVLGMGFMEDPSIPDGHFEILGARYRYTKPTLDELCAEAMERIAAGIQSHAALHQVAMDFEFAAARRRAELRYNASCTFMILRRLIAEARGA